MKAHYDKKPPVIERVAPGQYLFNYNIEQGDNDTGWLCEQVDIVGAPTYEKIVRAIIRSRYDESEEFSILNKYNAYNMGIGEESARNRYQEFLVEIQQVKTLVEAAFIDEAVYGQQIQGFREPK